MAQSIAKTLTCLAPGDELNGPAANLIEPSLDLASPRFFRAFIDGRIEAFNQRTMSAAPCLDGKSESAPKQFGSVSLHVSMLSRGPHG